MNWQRAYDGIRAGLVIGAPAPKLIQAYTGLRVAKVSPNPRTTPGGSVWTLVFDDAGFDLDGDGLTAERETALGTDPLRADSDGGGLEDAAEVARGADPLTPGDDQLERGQIADTVEYVLSLLPASSAHVVVLGSPFRFGRRFCGDAACADRLNALIEDVVAPVLSHDGRGVYGYAGGQLVERRFAGDERRFGALTTVGVLVPYPEGFVLYGPETGFRFYRHDGSYDLIDLDAQACDGRCDANLGTSAFSPIGQDPVTEDLMLAYRGNDEILLYRWHPARGLAIVGRNRLMPHVGGGYSGQLQSCQYTADGACLGVYLVSGGVSFPAHVNGRSLRFHQPFRMLTSGYPVRPLWADTFAGFAYPSTGRILDTLWVRMEDRIEPGDVITVDSALMRSSHPAPRVYRIGKEGGVLPLYGDNFDDYQTSPPAPRYFSSLPKARGIGAAADGRLCFVGADGNYRELVAPDDRGRPTTVLPVAGIANAVDCEFDPAGVAHVLANAPARIVLVDTRRAAPIVRTIPLPGLSATATHISTRSDGVDVIAQPPGKLHCVTVATGAGSDSFHDGHASSRAADGTSWIVDLDTYPKRLTGELCQAAYTEKTLAGDQLGPADFYDIVVRPDGLPVAQGYRQTLGGQDTTVDSLGVKGPLALVPGATWTDPFGHLHEQPDFAPGPDGGPDEPDADPSVGGCCDAGAASGPGTWLLVLGALAIRRRSRRSAGRDGRARAT